MTRGVVLLIGTVIHLIMHTSPCLAQGPVESIPATAQNEINADLAWLDGTWTGTVYQPSGSVQSYTLRLVASAAKNLYKVQYLSVSRRVVWTLLSGDDCQATFLERTTSGLPSLATIAVTRMRPSQTGSWYLTWSRYLEDGSLDAWSALKRK